MPSSAMRRLLVRPLLLVACAFGAGVSRADEPPTQPLRLSWVREATATTCPDARIVAGRVRERLGRDPFSDSAPTSAEVVVTARPGGFVAHIRIRDEQGALRGERTITSEESCDTLASATALALAIHIDPDAALRTPASRPSPPAAIAAPLAIAPLPTAPPPLAAPPTPPVPPPAHDRATPPGRAPFLRGGALSAGSFAASELVPGLAPGARITAELRPTSRVHALVVGVLVPERQTSDGHFAFGLAAGGPGACVDAVADRRLELAACAAVLAGEIHAVVYTLEPARPGGRFWVAGSVSARARFHLAPWLFIEGAAGAVVPFVRYAFDVVGRSGAVFQEAAFAPIADIGIGMTIR